MKTLLGCLSGLVVVLLFSPITAWAQDLDPDPYDRTEADYCAGCHAPVAVDQQPFIRDEWINTRHANSWAERNGNTYCMKCHAPFQADPLATHDDNVPVPIEESQAITCEVCHPDHNVRVFFDTPIGNYVVGSIDEPNADGVMNDNHTPDDPTDDTPVMGTWIPVFDGHESDLCTYCHEGRHEKKLNYMKNFQCTDCHMPDVPLVLSDGSVKMVRSHSFEFPLDDPDALAAKAEAACVGCHEILDLGFLDGGTSVEDAVAAIQSGLIHNDKPVVDPGGPYTGVAGQPVQFDASATTDPEGDDLDFVWDFGDDPPGDPGAGPTPTYTYAEAGTYTAQVSVSDGTNDPVTKSVEVVIEEPVGDNWHVKMPYLLTEFDVMFEPFAGILIVHTTTAEGTTVGLGMEFDGVIYWMDIAGTIYFGNIDREAGVMSGISLDGVTGSSIFFAEKL